MHKKFEINRTEIKGGCQSGRKVVTHDYKSNLPLPFIENGMVKYTNEKKNTRLKVFGKDSASISRIKRNGELQC